MSSDTPSNSTWVAISAEELAQLDHDLAAMTARAEAAERDAARYRWLRDVGDKTWTALVVRAQQAFPHVPRSEIPSMVDEIISGAIDAAREGK